MAEKKIKKKKIKKKMVVTRRKFDRRAAGSVSLVDPDPKNVMYYDKGFIDSLKSGLNKSIASLSGDVTPFSPKRTLFTYDPIVLDPPADVPKPGDPGWVSYKFSYATTPAPSLDTDIQKLDELLKKDIISDASMAWLLKHNGFARRSSADLVFGSLYSFGDQIMDLLDIIHDSRVRKALKKQIVRIYNEYATERYTDARDLDASDRVLVLKNTEESV